MDDAELRAWFDGQTAAHAFSGVALVRRAGEDVFSYAGGLAHRGHGVPVRPETRFAIASVTKMVTAILVLRLVERGRLALDRPLVEILEPEHRPAALSAGHTLHHLLSHTSGLANYHDDADETMASFTSCWDRIPTYHVRRPADMLPLFADLPPEAPPGARYAYSDAGFILAGLAAEDSTGQPYDKLVAEEVLRPAGMTDSGFESLDEEPGRLATGYVVDDGPPERWRSNIFSVTAVGMPDGGMISSAPDLVRLIDSLLDGSLLAPPLLAAMTRPQGPPSSEPELYGYGCQLGVADGSVAVFGHSGSDPGVSARVSHFLRAGTTVVVLCNQSRGSWAATLAIANALGLADPRATA